MLIRRFAPISLLALAAWSCGTNDARDESGLVETSVAAIAPAGSNAAYVSDDVPLSMNPGERLNVRFTMQNTGAASPANDWNGSYYLRRDPNMTSPFGFVQDPVVGTVPAQPNTDHQFWFVITAPTTAGTYSLGGRMYSNVAGQTGYFGQSRTVSGINVTGATQRRWSCQYEPTLSTLPGNMAPGSTQSVTITVRNTGTGTWPGSNNFCLRSRDDVGPSANYNLWGVPSTNSCSAAAVAPGTTRAFTFNITAPTTPGTYNLLRQMFSTGQPSATNVGLGFFDTLNHCVNHQVVVGTPTSFDASLASENFPRTMAPGESRTVTVVMQNSGTSDWLGGTTFALYSQNSPRSFWGVTHDFVDVDTGPNGLHTFTLPITAPTTPGNYTHRWRMRKLNNPTAGPFGFLIDIPVTVTPTAQLQYDAEIVSQVIPLTANQNANVTFTVTVRNNGTATWTGTSIELFSQNTPATLWLHQTLGTLTSTESIAPGQTRVFSRVVNTPAVAGIYDSRWQMRQSGPTGVGLFGDIAVTTGIDVNNCGNGVVDLSTNETCDDSNRTSGDGCSATCQIETQTIDLASQAAGRTLIGSRSNGQLANVAMGDVTQDGVADMAVGEIALITGPEGARIDAGRVAVYTGVGFFTGATTTVPTGVLVDVWGADAGDHLGGGATSGVEIGDVTGDSIPDLIVGAGLADGPSNGRLDCGQVYVLQGGAGLSGAGTVDLRANPSVLVATIVGRSAGDNLNILAVGDLNADGVADLVMGAPGDDQNGAEAGAVYIVRGGGTLTGTISLDAPGASLIGTLLGAAADDQLGLTAAIGDIGGAAANDLLVGSQTHSPGGRTRAGGAWAVFGAPTGTRNLATTFDARWLGREASDRMGTSVAIGNVRGTSRGDAVIGAIQFNDGASVQVGSVDIWDGPVAGTYDLSLAATPSTRIQGRDANDDAGRGLAVGDINGDGWADVPVISSQADGPGETRDRAGEIAWFLGGPVLPALIDLDVTGPAILVYGATALGRLGHHVQNFAFGNVDGGNDDYCVGSFLGGPTSQGRVDCFSSPF